ncbi:MAG: hypothetical protein HY321_19070 [Armatimonadetes bacterium]|nr:hypothetical protein [Armatimonadota bacterium]
MLLLPHPPLGRLGIGRRFNRTLHGRSRHRKADVPGHNVFNGYTRPGWGDALDLFCPAGTPVFALESCQQVLHRNDETRLEVVYLQGGRFLVVMAHIEAARPGTPRPYERGDVVGHVRGDLADPHLHLEVAFGRRGSEVPLTGRTPDELAARLRAILSPPLARVIDIRTCDVLGQVADPRDVPLHFPGYALVPGGDHRADQGKLYVERAAR